MWRVLHAVSSVALSPLHPTRPPATLLIAVREGSILYKCERRRHATSLEAQNEQEVKEDMRWEGKHGRLGCNTLFQMSSENRFVHVKVAAREVEPLS